MNKKEFGFEMIAGNVYRKPPGMILEESDRWIQLNVNTKMADEVMDYILQVPENCILKVSTRITLEVIELKGEENER